MSIQRLFGMRRDTSVNYRPAVSAALLIALLAPTAEGAWNDFLKPKSRATGGGSSTVTAAAPSAPKRSFFSRKPKNNTWTPPASSTPVVGTAKKSWTGNVGSAFKNAAKAVTPKPKLQDTDDPTTLASKMKPFSAETHAAYARLSETNGDLTQAERHYQEALKLDSRCTAAMLGIARLNHRQGKLDAAAEGYRQVAQLTPDDPVPLNELGLCYSQMGQSDQSVAALQAAVQRKPDSLLYRNNLASVLVDAKRPEEAVEQLRSTHGEAKARYNVAVLLYRRGENQAAEQYFAQAAQIDPNLTAAREMAEKVQGSAASVAMRANAAVSGFGNAYQNANNSLQQAANSLQQAQEVYLPSVPPAAPGPPSFDPNLPPAPQAPPVDAGPRRVGPFGYAPQPATSPTVTGPSRPLNYPAESTPRTPSTARLPAAP